MEGTGSCGAGLARHLASQGIKTVEVNRPNRQMRRSRGKNDTVDAEAAARAALNGQATAIPKSADGHAEAIRALSTVRRSAVKASTQAANQINGLIVNAPEDLRDHLTGRGASNTIKTCARLRPGANSDPVTAEFKRSLLMLARRHRDLTAEIAELDERLQHLCLQANPALLATTGVGPQVAATLLCAAGDNPQRMRSEASFAALCGASPVQASSGRIVRHRPRPRQQPQR